MSKPLFEHAWWNACLPYVIVFTVSTMLNRANLILHCHYNPEHSALSPIIRTEYNSKMVGGALNDKNATSPRLRMVYDYTPSSSHSFYVDIVYTKPFHQQLQINNFVMWLEMQLTGVIRYTWLFKISGMGLGVWGWVGVEVGGVGAWGCGWGVGVGVGVGLGGWVGWGVGVGWGWVGVGDAWGRGVGVCGCHLRSRLKVLVGGHSLYGWEWTKYIEAETKLYLFCRRHFEIHLSKFHRNLFPSVESTICKDWPG